MQPAEEGALPVAMATPIGPVVATDATVASTTMTPEDAAALAKAMAGTYEGTMNTGAAVGR